jgi:hypothetical protein
LCECIFRWLFCVRQVAHPLAQIAANRRTEASPMTLLSLRLIALTGLLLSIHAPALAQTNQRPNVLFIFLDDYGWRDAGLNGISAKIRFLTDLTSMWAARTAAVRPAVTFRHIPVRRGWMMPRKMNT